MPTIEFYKKDLEKLVGKKFGEQELSDALMLVKGEIDENEDGLIKLDVKETNNPELLSVEGIARKLKAGLGLKKRLTLPKIKKGKEKCVIDNNLKNIRPVIACCIVKNVSLNEEFLEQLIQLQEKLGLTFGRKRKEIGLGLYDADKIKFPLTYKGMKNNEVKFAPLEFNEEMTPKEILEKHEKGIEYGHLIKGSVYPILIDSNKKVASMPPIINSNETGKVTLGTKNIFIEATGLNWNNVETALKVLAMAFLERGFEVESMEVVAEGKSKTVPSFGFKKISFDKNQINKISGMEFNDKQLISLVSKTGMNAKIKGSKIEVEYLNTRSNILHAVDVIEEILVAFGYNEIKPLALRLPVVGRERKDSLYLDKIREAGIALGLQEIMTFNLTSKEKQGKKILSSGEKHLVELANPMSAEYNCMRHLLFPELLDFLSKNRSSLMSQKIFELGRVTSINETKESRVNETENICILLKGNDIDFNIIKSHLNALTESLGLTYEMKVLQKPFFKKGFSAELKLSNGLKGLIGLVSDEVKTNFQTGSEEIALVEIQMVEYEE